jgi:hypothetical protein
MALGTQTKVLTQANVAQHYDHQDVLVKRALTLVRQAALEFRAEAIRNFLDAVHHAFPGAAKSGILESHIDSSRQQPSCRTDRWQGSN